MPDLTPQLMESATRYVKGKMTAEEAVSFEKMMTDNPLLTDYVSVESEAYSLFVDKNALDLKDLMKNDLTTVPKKKINWKLLGGGLMIVSIGVLSLLIHEIDNDLTGGSIALPNESKEVGEEKETYADADPVSVVPERVSVKSATQEEDISDGVADPIESVGDGLVVPDDLADDKDTRVSLSEESKDKTESEASILPVKTDENTALPIVAKDMDPCDGIAFVGKLKTSPSLEGQSTGAILFQQSVIQGGESPYYFWVKSESDEFSDYDLRDLSAGTYEVKVRDNQGCVREFTGHEVIVKATKCRSDYQKTFSPDFENDWEMPINEEHNGKATIVNKTGQVIWESSFEAYEDIAWTGTSVSGDPVGAGALKVFIEYDDGEKCVASLMISR